MLERTERGETPRSPVESPERPGERDGTETVAPDDPGFRLARALFGGILAFMAVDNLRSLDERVQYAESKGAPAPNLSVPAISASLLVGGVGIALWRAPKAAASLVAAFLLAITPVMHDFWAIEDPEQRQQQQVHFLKNAALLGATLAFFELDRRRSVARG